MDEIDAALDYRNTSLLAKYIKEKKNVQHIVISLRKNMYQESHTLVGIYKVKDVTHSIRINMQDLY
jgi:structural maintenance of chromosome 4